MSKTVPLKKTCLLVVALAWALAIPRTAQADARSDGDLGISEFHRGNLIEAIRLLENSAAQGYLPAQTTLAFILDSAERDAEAYHWYRQAAQQRDPAGLFGLASMYAKGEGVDKNPEQAGRLFREAAELGHVEAMRVYAHALEHGLLGLAVSPHTAAEWYVRAAGLEDPVSIQRLVNAYSLGQLGLTPDAHRAESWRSKLRRPDGG